MIIPSLNIGLGLSGLITGAASSLAGLWQNHQNNKMMQKQMDYNTQEREASQSYNTSEREASQAYQTSERVAQNKYSEEMYTKYSSPQAMVDQYKKAGLNPRLAANGEGLGASVSGGSSGGAPSGAAPSGTHINPPYQNMAAMSDSFATMAQGAQALANAKKAGVETSNLERIFGEQLKSLQLDNAAKEFINSINYKYLDKKEKAALDNAISDIVLKKLQGEQLRAVIEGLAKDNIIKQNEVDTWYQAFNTQQENIKSDTGLKNEQSETEKTKQLYNRAQTTLTRLMQATEKEKPHLYRGIVNLNKSTERLNSLEYNIRSSNSVEEKKALQAKFKSEYVNFMRDYYDIYPDVESAESDEYEILGTLGSAYRNFMSSW